MNARQRRKHRKSTTEQTQWHSFDEDPLEQWRDEQNYDEVESNTYFVFIMITLMSIISVCLINLIRPEIAKFWIWICNNLKHVL